MKRLRHLMFLSIGIMCILMLYIYVRNYNQYGYIVLFKQIPLYKHYENNFNIWLTGMYTMFSLVSMSVFVGAFLHHFIMHKDIYFIKFDPNERSSIIIDSLVLWLWLISFSILLEVGLYGPGHKFRSIVGININYFNSQFTNQLIFSWQNNSWISLIIIFGLLFCLKYLYPWLKRYKEYRQTR